MSFAQPAWLFALLLIPLLAALFWRGEVRARERLATFVSMRLRERLVSGVSPVRRRLRFALLLLGMALAIAALARPQYGFSEREVKRHGRDVLIAIDTSKSMLANDTAPDRLARARLAAEDLLNALPGDRAGLIAFAGGAFLQAPLTIDYSAVRESLEALDTSVIPQGGTDIAGAIRAAVDAFGKSESSNRCLVIFSDGEDLTDDAVKTAQSVAGKIRIFTVGVGTPEGSLIPLPSEGSGTDFVKDQDGNFVKTRLDETRLRQVAEATGGISLRLGESFADMRRLVREGVANIAAEEMDARLSRQPIERYQWPLGASLLLLALSHCIPETRRRAALTRGQTAAPLAAAALAFLFIIPAQAAQPADAMGLYESGKYQDAYQAFQEQLKRRPDSPELHFNAGASAYEAKEYDKAIEEFTTAMTRSNALGTKPEYNLATALIQRGAAKADKKDLQNAIQHLESVLKSDPSNKNAQQNLEMAQSALAELDRPKPTPPPKQKDDQKKDEDQKKEKNEKQQSGGGGKDQEDQSDKGEKDDQTDSKEGEGEQKKQDPSDGKKDSPKKDPSQQASNGGQPSPSPTAGEKDPAKEQAAAQGSPSPTPGKEGEIQQAGRPQGSPSPGDGNAAASAGAGAEETPAPGEMTQQQAAMLLNSLKGDEKNVQLNEQRPTGPVLKDW